MTLEPNNPTDGVVSSKMSKKKKIVLIVVSIFLALILLLVSTFFILRTVGKKKLLNKDIEVSAPSEYVEWSDSEGKKIEYNGKRYSYNENLVSVLIMGIDKKNISAESVSGKNGQADVLILAVLDTKTGKIQMLPVSRDSMVDVDMYSANGKYAGVERTQICLAYAYSTTGEDGCQNVCRSMSRLLYGINIDYYVALDLSGLPVMTEAVGGVSVNVLESFSSNGSSFTEGQSIMLNKNNVATYIQYRDKDAEGNTRRMLRQKQFFTSFISKAGNLLVSDFSRLGDLYNSAKPYVVSNLALPEITYLVSSCLTTDIGQAIDFHSVLGTSALNGEHAEFYPDSEALFETIVKIFYEEATE